MINTTRQYAGLTISRVLHKQHARLPSYTAVHATMYAGVTRLNTLHFHCTSDNKGNYFT